MVYETLSNGSPFLITTEVLQTICFWSIHIVSFLSVPSPHSKYPLPLTPLSLLASAIPLSYPDPSSPPSPQPPQPPQPHHPLSCPQPPPPLVPSAAPQPLQT